jgi:uncharacterized membrane protein YgaE (UPF0421/DUF939 family)
MEHSNSTVIGTAGGTFLSVLPNLHSEDIVKTILLAIIGAIVSFTVSLLLKRLTKFKNK